MRDQVPAQGVSGFAVERSVCFPDAAFDLVVVAGSVGGISGARHLLAPLPPEFPAPIAMVQHLSPAVPSQLHRLLAGWCRLGVRFAVDGERLRARTVHLAPPDRHLTVAPGCRLRLTDGAKVNFTRPAADPLFQSAACVFGSRAVAVVLSGMGRDAARGAAAVRACGGTVIVQDPATAEAPQMPAAALATGAASLVLPLDAIAPALVALVMQPGVASLFAGARQAAA